MIRALLALAIWLLTSPALAAVQNCTFAWNARTDADLAGYKISWGTTSGTYPNVITLGTVTTTTCAALGMTSAATYYAVIAAFDTSNQVGANSSQISVTLATVTAPPTTPTITTFSPSSGAVGTSVTITGTNFSSTLGSNTVKFNGITATLSSGTTTQLVAVVPASATTGKISVTTSAGTVNSSADFTITTPPSSTVYDSAADFSNVQGPIWYYLNGDTTEMATYLASCTATSGACWQGANTYLTIYDHGAHPGDPTAPSTMKATRRWVAPGAGTVSISGSSSDETAAGGDGVLFTVVHNSTTTYYSRTIPSGGGNEIYSTTAFSVVVGDTIDFIIDPLTGDFWDGTNYTGVIAFSATPPPPPPPPDPPPPPPPALSLAALLTTTPSFNVATTATVTVTISNTATTDTPVLISSADPAIVAAPVSVTIPANSRTANMTVAGLVAGTTQLTATLGTSTLHITLTVLPTTAFSPVTLLSPANRSTLSSVVKFVILRWRSMLGATTYAVTVHDDTIDTENDSQLCAGFAACAPTTTATSYSFRPIPGHTYTWAVTWTDSGGHTSDPVSWTFAQESN